MQNVIGWFFVLWALPATSAQVTEALLLDCQSTLVRQGFENVRVGAAGPETLFVDYENRVFRNEVTAAGVVLASLDTTLAEIDVLALTPKHRDLPICTIFVPLQRYREFIAGRLDADALAEALTIEKGHDPSNKTQMTKQTASSLRRFDVTIRPATAFQLGNYDDRLKISLSLMPEISTTLWRGGRLLAQAIIPLHDEIGVYTDEVRLGRLALSQWLQLPGDGFAALSIGGFSPDRYGVAGEFNQFLFHRHIKLGAAAEYSGFLLRQNDYWNYSDLDRFTWRGFCNYIFTPIDLVVGLQYAEFLMEDHGWQFEITRLYRDAEVAVYAAKTNVDKFGGVRLKIPLPPRRSARPGRIRLISPGYYQLGYQATNEVYTVAEPVATGITISTGNELAALPKLLFPGYIRNNLSLWKAAAAFLR